jgi:hypothetical protein
MDVANNEEELEMVPLHNRDISIRRETDRQTSLKKSHTKISQVERDVISMS